MLEGAPQYSQVSAIWLRPLRARSEKTICLDRSLFHATGIDGHL